MPKQNRPVVRDGRIQAPPKKRTDRSYLGGAAPPPAPAPAAEPEPTQAEAAPAVDVVEAAVAETAAPIVPEQAPAIPAPPAPAASVPVTRTARALQQQGVQRRRGVDLEAMARRDTSYAMHELRRISVLTVMVVGTLVALGVFLR